MAAKRRDWSWRSRAVRGLIYQVVAVAVIAAIVFLPLTVRHIARDDHEAARAIHAAGVAPRFDDQPFANQIQVRPADFSF